MSDNRFYNAVPVYGEVWIQSRLHAVGPNEFAYQSRKQEAGPDGTLGPWSEWTDDGVTIRLGVNESAKKRPWWKVLG